jgi:hypothetical protein
VEITPFFGVLVCLPVTLLFLWLRQVFWKLFVWVIFLIIFCFGFADQNSYFFWCLNLFLILTTYRYAGPSDEISRKSISVWMYSCRAPQYFRTKCHSESLIPSLVRMVWKVLVKYGTAWPIYYRSVVHLMYWSS